jgi:lysozyme
MNARTLGIFLGLVGFAGAAYALTRSARNGPAEGVNWDTLPYDFIDMGEAFVNQATEQPAAVPIDQAEANVRAFLQAIIAAEGTAQRGDPYRATFGYSHVIQDLSDHPYYTGEWKGAPFYSGGREQWSTAAGAYQFLRRTWAGLRVNLGLPDFSPASQDAAAIELIRERGALEDVKAGRFATAVEKVRRVWASLPGAGYGQPERQLASLQAAYINAGGTLA